MLVIGWNRVRLVLKPWLGLVWLEGLKRACYIRLIRCKLSNLVFIWGKSCLHSSELHVFTIFILFVIFLLNVWWVPKKVGVLWWHFETEVFHAWHCKCCWWCKSICFITFQMPAHNSSVFVWLQSLVLFCGRGKNECSVSVVKAKLQAQMESRAFHWIFTASFFPPLPPLCLFLIFC